MSKRTHLFLQSALVVLVMIGANAMAQTASPFPSNRGVSPQTLPSKGGQNHAGVERNPACQRIIGECKRLGFIQGEWKEDNGLWRDCFDPVVKGGGQATRDGKPIHVPVSAKDIQACRATEGHHKL